MNGPERWAHHEPPKVPTVPTVYPVETKPAPVLYGPTGEPLFVAPKPFGYRKDADR